MEGLSEAESKGKERTSRRNSTSLLKLKGKINRRDKKKETEPRWEKKEIRRVIDPKAFLGGPVAKSLRRDKKGRSGKRDQSALGS